MNFGNVRALIGSLITYGILTFLLPELCFGKYIRNKGLAFRFFFCQCAGNLYVNFSVLFLGYIKAFNVVTAYIFMFVIPIFAVGVRERKRLLDSLKLARQTLDELVAGTYGIKLFIWNIGKRIQNKVSYWKKRYLSGNVLEILIFSGVLCWLIWFYGWYKLHYVAHSHTDEETHLYWISELLDGNIFPVGMYPHGMHTLVATISILTGLTATRVNLVFCILSFSFIYTAAYLFYRRMFSHIYVALFGWVAVALLDVFNVIAYFRFQSSFPMEFGLIAAFGMMYAMFEYIETKDKMQMVLFSLCISWTLMAHFYITILCAVICLCFGLIYGLYLWKKKLLVSFIIAGLAGIFLAAIPYGVGYVLGYPFERSIAWALSMTTTNQENDAANPNQEEGLIDEFGEDILKDLIDDIDEPLPEEIRERFTSLEVYLTEAYVKNRNISSAFLYTHMVMLVISVGLMCHKKDRKMGYRWLFFTVFWFVGAVMVCSYFLKILVLIEVKRMAAFLMFFTIPMFSFGAELIYRLMGQIKKLNVSYIAMSAVLLELIAMIATDNLRKERYFEISISEGDMLVSLDLAENKEDFTWTLISPTNDLSVVRYDGYHYEIIDLIKKIDAGEKALYIPTPEIYALVEIKPISFGNSRREIDHSDMVSKENVMEISSELAVQDVDYNAYVSDIHKEDAPYYFQRDYVMSKMYFWMQAVKEVYPSHVSEYYRDEQVVVYKIEQDPFFLLNLSLDYKSTAERHEGI